MYSIVTIDHRLQMEFRQNFNQSQVSSKISSIILIRPVSTRILDFTHFPANCHS
jgi:hypothetical protein